MFIAGAVPLILIKQRGIHMTTQLKVKPFTGVQKIAPETIEKHDLEQQLRAAQYALDLQLHDLRAEFIHRESKLRQDYLDRVAAITSGE
jgi:hypothetical protein